MRYGSAFRSAFSAALRFTLDYLTSPAYMGWGMKGGRKDEKGRE
jgi:hypothetical protein